MINAGKEFRHAFFQLLETFGGTIIIHKNFNCSNPELIELKGMKNSEKGNSSKIMFQFPEKFEITIGDVIQQSGSSDYWKIYRTEERIVTDVFVCFIAYVKGIDKNGNPVNR